MNRPIARTLLSVLPPSVSASRECVHVLRIQLGGFETHASEAEDWLSSEERTRAARFASHRDRARFAITRATLRISLGRFLETDPRAIEFCAGSHGKPALFSTSAPPALAFNVSHSNDLAVIAIGYDRYIGVDVEAVRPKRDLLDVARRVFAPEEVAGLESLPPTVLAEAFYACWTCKESYVKARGDGLSAGLQSFSVEVRPDRPPRLLSAADPAEVGRWRISRLSLAAGYCSALTADGAPFTIRIWDAPPVPALCGFPRETRTST